MKKTTLYIGLNDKDTKHQEIATLDAYKIAVNIFTAYTGGRDHIGSRGDLHARQRRNGHRKNLKV